MRALLVGFAALWSGVTLGAVLAGQWWTAVICWLTTAALMVAANGFRRDPFPEGLRVPGRIEYECHVCGDVFDATEPDVEMWCDMVTAHVRGHRSDMDGALEQYRSALVAEALAARG